MTARQDSERIVTVVTGAGSGIGAALCRRLARPGLALVINTGHNRDGLERVAADCQRSGAQVVTQVGDLCDAETAAALVTLAEQKFGHLDHLVHAAGFAERRPFGELDNARLAKSFDVIVGAFLQLVSAALPLLSRSPRGRVIAISSFLAHCYQLVAGSYPASAAAKAGLEAMMRSLAAQLAASGCAVNCVVPGYIRKDSGAESSLSEAEWRQVAERVPMKRLGTPAEIAAAVEFLLSDAAGYITGQCLHVNGGLTL